jgi:Tfp pilus assembly protein PilP
MKLLSILISVLVISGCSFNVKGEDHIVSEQNKLMAIQEKETLQQKKEAEDLERQRYYDEKFRKYEN